MYFLQTEEQNYIVWLKFSLSIVRINACLNMRDDIFNIFDLITVKNMSDEKYTKL